MPKYKGKRNYVTFPVAVYETIESLAKKETKSFSQMAVTLCEEALKARNVTIEEKQNDQQQ